MEKRVLCFLASAVLALTLCFQAFAGCNHKDEDGEPLKYKLVGYVAPQVGVPGYSGDFCCPVCGAVVQKGSTLPALEQPGRRGSGDTGEQQDKPADRADDRTEPQAKPDVPGRPGSSAKKDKQGRTGKGSSGENGPEPVQRERFSVKFPYRRVRMQAEEGILAAAAGLLLWPASPSPFQGMLGE